MSPADERWMELALASAEQGRGRVEPNPLVGAVVVREGSLVGIGHHPRFGGPHAEVVALEQAGELARGATLYVTLEPCCHHGKTPPCTEAVIKAGITRVVAATRDPFPRVAGGGIALLRQAGIAVEVGLGAAASIAMNGPYLKRVTTGLPYVTAKWAMTLDGKCATRDGDSKWISSVESRAQVHEVRGRMDAIVAGIGTVLADDPLLTARPPGTRTALRVVLDSAGRLPANCQLAQTAREVPVLIATTTRAPSERLAKLEALGCELLVTEGSPRVSIAALLSELGKRDMTNVLVEGGGHVLGSFLDAGQVDELIVYIAMALEGGDHARTPARGVGVAAMREAQRLDGVVHKMVDGDLCVCGRVPRKWRESLACLAEEDQALP